MPASATAASPANSRSKTKSTARTGADVGGAEMSELLAALRAFRRGDFSVRLPRGMTGVAGELAEAFNDVVELNDRMTKEF